MGSGCAPRTSAAYATPIKGLKKFCSEFSTEKWALPWWEPDEVLVVLFLSYLAPYVAINTVKVYMYGLRDYMLKLQLPDPTHSYFVEQAWKGIKRSKRTEPDQRLILEFSMLLALKSFLVKVWRSKKKSRAADVQWHNWLVCFVVCVWGFFGLFRVGELVKSGTERSCRILRGCHVWKAFFEGVEMIMVELDGSKTDPFRRGCLVPLGKLAIEWICPFELLDRYRDSLQTLNLRSNEQLPFFRRADGKPLDRAVFVTTMRELLIRADVKTGAAFNGISLRRGGARALELAGASKDAIQRAGRWSSDCYKLYVGSQYSALVAEQKTMALSVSA